MSGKCRKHCPVVCLLSSLFCLILGVVSIFVFKFVIYQQVKNSIPIYNGSSSYSQWQKPSIPIYLQFWFFDVSNAAEVIEGTKPSLLQIGPFTYREHREKFDIVFHNNGTVTYKERRWFNFDRSMSSGDDRTTTFTSVDLVTLVVSNMMQQKHIPSALDWVVNQIIKLFDKHGLFRNYTVRDIIWGYEDPLLKDLDYYLKKIGITVPFKIGLFLNNNTDDGYYNIYTGKEDLSLFSVINTWKNSSKMTFWSSNITNMVNGTDGVTFPPFITTSDHLYVFSSDICRSLKFSYVEPRQVRGIDVMRFSPTAYEFANSSVNPDNEGFCIPNCLGAGVLNMSTCTGQPAIMSQPHFYQGADKYIDSVRGMHPSIESATVVDVEPHTGVALHAAKKLQINMDLHPVKGFTQTEKVKPVFLPVMWLNESATADHDLANQFYNQVVLPVLITQVVQYFLIALGALGLLLLGLFFVGVFLRKRGGSGETTPILSQVDEPLDIHEQGHVQANGTTNVNV